MSQIQATDATTTALQRTPTGGFNEMSTEDFIRIIFAELANQDPFQPNDSSALLDQLNSIRSIESDVKLIERLDSLIFGNQLASAGNLLGQVVGGLNENNDRVLGFVIRIVRQGDEVQLELDSGDIITFDNVETVLDQILFESLMQDQDSGDSPTSGDGA